VPVPQKRRQLARARAGRECLVGGHIDKFDFNIQNYSFAKILVALRFKLVRSCSIAAKLSRLRVVCPHFSRSAILPQTGRLLAAGLFFGRVQRAVMN